MGCLGMGCIIIGSYFLQLSDLRRGVLGPIRALVENRGTRAMLIAAVIWGMTGVVDRIGVAHSSPLFWSAVLPSSIALCLLPTVIGRIRVNDILARAPWFAGAAIFYSGMIICFMVGITHGIVVYVVSVKRLSLVLSVVLGRILFKEGNFRERFVATLVMLAGVTILAFSK